ncbi:hypothetical protein [Arcanobacterium hippocoleae]|uniref:hypothetical protein n=1 Tax=Arcanobacterium hippocoleae TaxID=149017 RepID=UPI00333F159C
MGMARHQQCIQSQQFRANEQENLQTGNGKNPFEYCGFRVGSQTQHPRGQALRDSYLNDYDNRCQKDIFFDLPTRCQRKKAAHNFIPFFSNI